jgi:2-iminobutanoate/2-iminopropanoate deaminase
MMPWDKDRKLVGGNDVKEQTRQVLRNMEATLKAAGASLRNVVKITFFITDIRDKQAIWDVRKEMFGDCRPASTLVQVSHLVDPLARLEVEAIAYVGD